jgi:hypothetical protein
MSDRDVRIYEVGPRDGLQNEASPIPTDAKLRFIGLLADAGLREIEATSFVSPKAVPQLADADELMAGLDRRPDVRYPVLVPNARGMDRAVAAGADAVCVFTAASEAFTQANINMTIAESIDTFRPVVDRARELGWWTRGYVSTAFGCPYQGEVGEAAVKTQTASAPAASARSRPRAFGTSTGYRTPGRRSRPARSASASASCGTARGATKLVASISRRPASARRPMNRSFAAVGIGDASFWRPSRGPTS